MLGIALAAVAFGSSPRVRGTPFFLFRRLLLVRFIPASAGNATCGLGTPDSPPVHPRECGERQRGRFFFPDSDGSSPRVRGTLVGHCHDAIDQRFIPASAGNASRREPAKRDQPVHPRECGERRVAAAVVRRGSGSSPRVRGTLSPSELRRLLARFIPASAGNALPAVRRSKVGSVHPRECGERAFVLIKLGKRVGSSPRVRGTPTAANHDRLADRFIPASAGNASRRNRRSRRGAVHPRECGERYVWPGHAGFAAGSSPRVRGTRCYVRPRDSIPRFIPASAGNATKVSAGTNVSPVHPRECGERATSALSTMTLNGSSPRVRGTRRRSRP